MRGWRSADRRTCSNVARVRRDLSAPGGVRAPHDAGRSPLGAPPWRFLAGGRASISGIASGSVQRAPRSQVLMPGGRCPGPPESAVTSRSRRTPLPAPSSGSSPEDAPSERGCETYTINPLRSQLISSHRSRKRHCARFYRSSCAGLTRASIVFVRNLGGGDGSQGHSGWPECRVLSAASRVNPTCGVKPGDDSGMCTPTSVPSRR
jgi:hypothetical protein